MKFNDLQEGVVSDQLIMMVIRLRKKLVFYEHGWDLRSTSTSTMWRGYAAMGCIAACTTYGTSRILGIGGSTL